MALSSLLRTRIVLLISCLCATVAPAVATPTGLRQAIPLDRGRSGATCIGAGHVDQLLQSVPVGDDTLGLFGRVIEAGANGICETPVVNGADVAVVAVGAGMPNTAVIRAGVGSAGICGGPYALRINGSSPPLPLVANAWTAGASWADQVPALDPASGGDDVPVVAPGNSQSHMPAVTYGANGMLDSAVGNDDLAAAEAICPDPTVPSARLESTKAGDDIVQTANSGTFCSMCENRNECILPGPNGVLDTILEYPDFQRLYVSTGADGVSDTIASGGDRQVIPLDEGFVGTVCVHSGADGIAQTSLCGNGVEDSEENGLAETGAQRGQEADDSNWTDDDGVSAICVEEFCGDGIVQGGEVCDAGIDPDCVNVGGVCALPVCGDGDVHRPGRGRHPNVNVSGTMKFEECDPGAPVADDGCDADCQLDVQAGNGELDAGEECDDGNRNNNDDCVANGRLATCADRSFHRQHSANLLLQSSLTVPELEECSPPGTRFCDETCHLRPCGNGVVDPGEECDPRFVRNCTKDCKLRPSCGDGIVTPPREECEPPFTDVCDENCKRQTSLCCDNDGQLERGEQCDDGNRIDTDACANNCKVAFCGDGIRHVRPPFDIAICTSGGVFERGNACDPNQPVSCGSASPECTEIRRGGICEKGILWETCTSDPECGADATCSPLGSCIAGRVLAPCTTDPECDTAAGGDGICKRLCERNGARVRKTCDTNSDCDTPGHNDGRCVGEECDDSNNDGGDGCDATCLRECGNGVIDPGTCIQGRGVSEGRCVSGICRQGRIGDTCALDTDCTVDPICRDGICVVGRKGDACVSDFDCRLLLSRCQVDADCEVEAIEGHCDDVAGTCVEGDLGGACDDDADCDVAPFAGVCDREECDPGAGFFCADGVSERCSESCKLEVCGNGVRECGEECDLGPDNGPQGICSDACTTRLAGRSEVSGARECNMAWTIDDPPAAGPTPTPAAFVKSRRSCIDNDPTCDWDGEIGSCGFKVALCLHVPSGACSASDVGEVDFLGTKGPIEIVEQLRDQIVELASAQSRSIKVDQCRKKRALCVASDQPGGAALCPDFDDTCSVPRMARFDPPLVAGSAALCTDLNDVAVSLNGSKRATVKLKTRARWVEARPSPTPGKKRSDSDVITLVCLKSSEPTPTPTSTPTPGGGGGLGAAGNRPPPVHPECPLDP